jgi:hypothetical protein
VQQQIIYVYNFTCNYFLACVQKLVTNLAFCAVLFMTATFFSL